MKKYLLVMAVFVMIMSCFFGKTLVMASAEGSEPAACRYYTNIEVKRGDSLWSIAETYYENSGMSIKEYIKELKAMNGMASDHIKAGDSLTIVYFADEPVPAAGK